MTKRPKKTPLDAAIDAVMRCTICSAKMGACDCWIDCACGWLYEPGTVCRNPIHAPERRRKPQ